MQIPDKRNPVRYFLIYGRIMIKLENVSKSFSVKKENVEAVKDVNLEIADGEIFGIIGFSGAGKSTLVRCINLLERPDKGNVYIDGTNLLSLKEGQLRKYRKKIGMIFQQFNLLMQSNVIDNITYPLEISGLSKMKAREKARELLKIVELSDKENAYPVQLSGGQKQRVAIARALATDPKVLLCDEATSALDPLTTNSILKLIKDINKKMGVTVIVITHEMKVVEQICDRVAVMNHGVIEEVGDVRQIFTNPKSKTAKKLVITGEKTNEAPISTDYIRIVFDGQSSYTPVLAELILETKEKLNIIGANTEDIGGSAYGQLLIERPENENAAKIIKTYLENHNITFEEHFIQENLNQEEVAV